MLPVPHSLMAYIYAALMQQNPEVPEREREASVQHRRETVDLRRRFEIYSFT